MRMKCYSVRLKSLTSISDKCYKAIAFDGSEALIPKSQVAGIDADVNNSEAYWISEWILDQKNLQFSRKKTATFLIENGIVQKRLPEIKVKTHVPKEIKNVDINYDKDLER